METIRENRPVTHNTQERTVFYILMSVLIGAIFGRNIIHLPIPVILFLALAGCIAVFGGKNEIVAMIICCIPLSTAFQYKYALFLCIAIYYIKYPKDFKITVVLLPLICMMLWEMLHGFQWDLSIYEYFRGFAELIACTFLMSLRSKDFDYAFICRMLAVCAVSMMFVVLLNLLDAANYDFEAIFTGSYRFGVGDATAENFGVNYNPNSLGFICNLSIVGLLQLIIAKKQTWTDYLFIILLIFFGFMTMSRAFLLCFAAIFGLTVFAGKVKWSERILRIAGIIIFMLVVVLAIWLFMPTVFEKFLDRFIKEEDISNGRIDLFAFYNQHIFSKFEYWFFGIGLQDIEGKMVHLYGDIGDVLHNGPQELIVVWGFPGLMCFIWWVMLLVSSAKNEKKYRFEQFLPLILIFLQVQFGQLISSGIALLSFSFAYLSLCFSNEEKGHEKDFQKNY